MYPTRWRVAMSRASTTLPKSLAWPSVASSRPVSIFMVVDLPQPLEPRKPKISPRRIRKLTRSTAVKAPKRMVRLCASMAMSSSATCSGGITTGTWPRFFSSGSSAMKASSSEAVAVRASSCAGVPVASTWPASMATSQSKRCASSM